VVPFRRRSSSSLSEATTTPALACQGPDADGRAVDQLEEDAGRRVADADFMKAGTKRAYVGHRHAPSEQGIDDRDALGVDLHARPQAATGIAEQSAANRQERDADDKNQRDLATARVLVQRIHVPPVTAFFITATR
jgi:hypothetical protein